MSNSVLKFIGIFSILCFQFCLASISSGIAKRLYGCFSLNENNCITYIHTCVIVKCTVYPTIYIPSSKAIITLSWYSQIITTMRWNVYNEQTAYCKSLQLAMTLLTLPLDKTPSNSRHVTFTSKTNFYVLVFGVVCSNIWYPRNN